MHRFLAFQRGFRAAVNIEGASAGQSINQYSFIAV